VVIGAGDCGKAEDELSRTATAVIKHFIEIVRSWPLVFIEFSTAVASGLRLHIVQACSRKKYDPKPIRKRNIQKINAY
jgi:hypothetical protein